MATAPGRHLLLCAGLAAGTAVARRRAADADSWPRPWSWRWRCSASRRTLLSRAERLGLQAVAALAIAAHLSHLPLAAALVLLVLAVARRWRPALRCALPLGVAVAALLSTNLAMYGRFALSPSWRGLRPRPAGRRRPGRRTIEARCPAAGWHLCRWTGRLPTDSDAFLWSGHGPVGAPRRRWRRTRFPARSACKPPQAAAILAETLWREPLAVVRAAAGNAWTQFRRARVGDARPENLAASVGREFAIGFPAAEQAQFAAGMQARGLLPVLAAPFLALHPRGAAARRRAMLFGGAAPRWPGMRGCLGLVVAVLVRVTVNAAVTGALSGPHDRYQAHRRRCR